MMKQSARWAERHRRRYMGSTKADDAEAQMSLKVASILKGLSTVPKA